MSNKITYKDAGVDIEKGDQFVSNITKMVKSTYGPEVVSGIGGFASLYARDEETYISSATDGVGTKLMLAQELNIHHTVGIDLVAMCVNDLICNGSRPLFFLDYIATGKLDNQVAEDIVRGIVEGCKQSGAALMGGETAEMPGMYGPGHYDLAGFAVGEVKKKAVIDGQAVEEGMELLGMASSGFHSNGYSLLRKLASSEDKGLLEKLLEPTAIYVKEVLQLLDQCCDQVAGLAHITGSGLLNIARVNNQFDYLVEGMPRFSQIPEVFELIAKKSGLDNFELYRTFNMGVGMVLIVKDAETIAKKLDRPTFKLGKVTKGTGKVKINGKVL